MLKTAANVAICSTHDEGSDCGSDMTCQNPEATETIPRNVLPYLYGLHGLENASSSYLSSPPMDDGEHGHEDDEQLELYGRIVNDIEGLLGEPNIQSLTQLVEEILGGESVYNPEKAEATSIVGHIAHDDTPESEVENTIAVGDIESKHNPVDIAAAIAPYQLKSKSSGSSLKSTESGWSVTSARPSNTSETSPPPESVPKSIKGIGIDCDPKALP